MSNNNNHKHSVCAFSEPLISYLYGEIGASEKIEFEAHLKTCADCYNELTEFALARSAVREWRGSEFDTLATPTFEVPFDNVKTHTIEANVSPSWFDGLRQIFSFKPALAMSAFAILIALFGLTLLVSKFNVNNEVAGKRDDSNIIKAAVTPTIEKSIEQPQPIAAETSEKSAVRNVPTKIVDKKPVAPKNPVIRVSTPAPKYIAPQVVPVRTIQNPNKGNQKSVVAQQTKVPRLTDAEDEEDNSVRLADLFDEIGTR